MSAVRRVGIVSIWCNRGQATVSRALVQGLETLGHRVSILARPTRPPPGRPPMLETTGIWAHPRLVRASSYHVPLAEYQAWVRDQALDCVLFDQNYQFEEIASLRAMGVRTIARFVWEQFERHHLAPALEALDCIYSLTLSEQRRYQDWGYASPLVRWGIPPDHLGFDAVPRQSFPTFFFPASDQRKWFDATLKGFERADVPQSRLLVKTQEARRAVELQGSHGRVVHDSRDLGFADYHQLLASTHAVIAPSKWEGLGLHVFDAIAHGLPQILIDMPPVNEWVRHEVNGLLVPGQPVECSPSGVQGYNCRPEDLADAIRRLADRDLWEQLNEGARQTRARMRFEHTLADLATLIA